MRQGGVRAKPSGKVSRQRSNVCGSLRMRQKSSVAPWFNSLDSILAWLRQPIPRRRTRRMLLHAAGANEDAPSLGELVDLVRTLLDDEVDELGQREVRPKVAADGEQ